MARKKSQEPTPPRIQGVDWNASSADFKRAQVSNVQPGGTRVKPEYKGADTGMFAGSGTPLGTSIGMTDTSRKHVTNVVKDLAIQEIGGELIGKLVGEAIAAARPMYYGIHGSESGLAKLTPQIGKNTESFLANMQNIGDTSVTSPKVFSYKPEVQNVLPVTDYAQMAAGTGQGSVYLAKTPARNIASNIVDTSRAVSASDAFAATSLANEQMSSKAMNVVKEFPISDYTTRTFDTMEGVWETSQNFSPLSGQINEAIQADKKVVASVASKVAKAASLARQSKKK